MTSVGGVGPFHVVERSKGWTLGGVSIFVRVCVCVRAFVCARALSLAARRVLFPVSSEGAKFRRLVVCLYDTPEAQTLESN